MTFYDVGANIVFFHCSPHDWSANREAWWLLKPIRRLLGVCVRISAAMRRRQFPWKKKPSGPRRHRCYSRADAKASPDRGLGHVLGEPSEEAGRDAIRVQAITLDDYALRSKSPDFIKCDVEGAEVEVFHGAQRILSQEKPDILFELHGENNRRILLEDLARFGYRCEPWGENHIRAQHPERQSAHNL